MTMYFLIIGDPDLRQDLNSQTMILSWWSALESY